jgi:hypothetical protein
LALNRRTDAASVGAKQIAMEAIMSAHRLRFGRHWRLSLLLTVLVLYLPFSWLLLIDYPWNSYRFLWLKLWCILPGFGIFLRLHPMNQTIEFTAMAIMTLALMGLLTWVGSHNRTWLVVAGVLGFALEVYYSVIAYAVFRA